MLWRDSFATQGVTHATLPPVLLADLPEDLPLQTLIVAGEACPAAVVARVVARARRMINAYGPTETTVCATMSETLVGALVPSRLADRFGTRGFTYWTGACSLYRPGFAGSFTLRVRGWRGAIWGVRG